MKVKNFFNTVLEVLLKSNAGQEIFNHQISQKDSAWYFYITEAGSMYIRGKIIYFNDTFSISHLTLSSKNYESQIRADDAYMEQKNVPKKFSDFINRKKHNISFVT